MVYVDLLSVAIASIVAIILACFWFSEKLFGKTVKKQREIETWKKPKAIIVSIISVFIVAYCLSFVLAYFNVVNFLDGAAAGGVIFLGLVFPVKLVFFMWSKTRLRFFLIESLFLALSFLVMGGILAS